MEEYSKKDYKLAAFISYLLFFVAATFAFIFILLTFGYVIPKAILIISAIACIIAAFSFKSTAYEADEKAKVQQDESKKIDE